MEQFGQIIALIKSFLWQGPLLIMLVLTGLYLSFQLRFLQIRHFFTALKLLLKPEKQGNPKGDLSPFAALMTALAGAIGTGNITGIAVAISLGGLGSLFWMWCIALIGMVTAYGEATLAVYYRTQTKEGGYAGGPMYTICKGLGRKGLGRLFAVFGVIASFGIGATVQSNSVALGLEEAARVPLWISGLLLAFITGLVVLGGIRSIGRLVCILVPFMAGAYVFAGLIVCGFHYDRIFPSLVAIVQSAFGFQACLGGFAGSALLLAVEQGGANGIFANEAGLGSLAIAASSAKTSEPSHQGLYGIAGVFFATMVICTVTGMSIAVSGVDPSVFSGSALTIKAFSSVTDYFRWVVVIGLLLFAFTTILAWAYYGEKCLEFLFTSKVIPYYRACYLALIFIGSFVQAKIIWDFANLANGLMAIPNLISLVILTPKIKELSRKLLE